MYGVTVYLDNETEKMCLGYKPVNEWIISIRLNDKQRNITIVQVCAPMSQADEEDIEKVYAKLQSMIDVINYRDILIILGDFNAKLGKGYTTTKLIGPYGLGERNERGNRLEKLVIENNQAVTNTLFQQPKRSLYIWTTPNDEHRNQIDFILIKQKVRVSVKNAKTLPAVDCGTDHEMLSIMLKLKMVKMKREPNSVCYDMNNISREFTDEIKNRFSLLLQDIREQEPEEIAESAKMILIEVAKEHIPKREKNMDEELEVELTEDLNNREPMRGEIELAIKYLKAGKSPGCDLVTAKKIKASGEQGIDANHHLCKKIWHQRKCHRNGKDQYLYQYLKKEI